MMAPGKRTLFLKGRIPSRLGSSTDSAMFATEEKQTVVLQREREGDEESEEEKGKVVNAMCVGLVLFGFGLVGRILVPSDFFIFF